MNSYYGANFLWVLNLFGTHRNEKVPEQEVANYSVEKLMLFKWYLSIELITISHTLVSLCEQLTK